MSHEPSTQMIAVLTVIVLKVQNKSKNYLLILTSLLQSLQY